jgi:hypothetical protein
MNPAPSVSAAEPRTNVRRASNPARLLYAAVAALLLVLTALGFQQFYLHGRAYPAHELPPPLKTILIVHGIAMTGWILLFLVQSLLIAGGSRRVHMALGWLGTALAACIVFVGLRVPLATTRIEPDIVLWGLHRKQFTAIPMISVSLFGFFVALAVWQRKRAAIHRPMMLLATLSIIAAATDRITGVPALYGATIFGRIFGPFFPALVIGGLFLALKSALTRKFDAWLALGFTFLVLSSASIMVIAPSHAWETFITALLT